MYPPTRQFSYFSWASRIKLDFFSMIFQGSWFVQYKSFPPPEGRPRGFASSYKPSPQSFRENRASCCTLFFRTGAPAVPPEGSSERDTQLSVLQVLPLTFLVSFCLRAELRGDPPLQRQGKRGISQSSQGSCGTCSAMLQGDAFTSSKSVVQYSWKLT